MENRFTPLQLGPPSRRRILRNRVVLPPMASETADERGHVTSRTLAHYARLAKSGAALLMVEYTYVSRDGRSEPNQLGASDETHAPGLQDLASLLKAQGAVAGLQLTHSGGKTTRELADGALWGPSDVPVPAKDRELGRPDPLPLENVPALVRSFVEAARRASEAGFDLVELHAAHGYGLNQWLSPLTNRRSDAYGGSPAGRARLLLEIVRGIRAAFPELLLAVRVPGQDHLPGGLTRDDTLQLSRWLEEAGVDLIDVSSGLGGWRRPRDRQGEGYLVEEAQAIQAGIALPAIGVGGIETGAYIDRSLRERKFSLAAVGRAILKDPELFRLTTLRE